MTSKLILLALLLISDFVYAQKTSYIPLYIQDTTTIEGRQFTWTKTAQSANFTLIWGDSAGLNPTTATNPSLVFNPASILDTMETIYQAFKNLGFANDTIGTNLNLYKIPIIMLNTYGPTGPMGWAYGGQVDGIIGAFWANPLAMQDGQVAAHELVHSLQSQIVIDFRTPNAIGYAWDNMQIFWETHANFMRNIIYPQAANAWGMDLYGMESWGQWKNTYENYHLLFAIKEEDGIGIINKMWKEGFSYEYPIAAYKRLSNYSQQALNDKLYKYARRMPTFDYPTDNLGQVLRASRTHNMTNFIPSVQTLYTILKKDTLNGNRYLAPIEIAPEEYGYNIIPLNPNEDSCAVIIKFKGHTAINQYAGWRYGFVTSLADGSISRYSDTYDADEATIGFELLPNEHQMYLVVMGAPTSITTNVNHDTWKGYPKRYRFPYEVTISGGTPEGHQAPPAFRSHLKSNGRIHANGGGWVSNAANVANTVYVAPRAMVMGNSNITGNVVIDNTAMVRNATISGNAIIKDNALVVGGNISGSAIIAGQAFVENDIIFGNARVDMRARVSNYRLHGSIHVGGDVIVYNTTGDCDNGVYFRMTNFFENNLLECDNRTVMHPNNTDVNNVLVPFTAAQMNLNCNCSNFPGCLTVKTSSLEDAIDCKIFPNPTSGILIIELAEIDASEITLYNGIGMKILNIQNEEAKIQIDLSNFEAGMYFVHIKSGEKTIVKKILLTR